MSCDWDVYCLDCKKEYGFYDANHQDKLMRELARLGPHIKKICELMPALVALGDPPHNLYCNPQIVLDDGSRFRLTFGWWALHGDHRLVARDEYGRCDDECGEHFSCDSCGSSKCCRRAKGHDGDHKDKRDEDEKK